MSVPAQGFTAWRKSSHSNNDGACVEVGRDALTIGVRDTTENGEGAVLRFRPSGWSAFVTAVARPGSELAGGF